MTHRSSGPLSPLDPACALDEPRKNGFAVPMPVSGRLRPLLHQYDFAVRRLLDRLTGPAFDSGNGTPVNVPSLGEAEYLWEPAPGCWSVRHRSYGPGERADALSGTGDWGRDVAGFPHPWPPPLTTIAWRLTHLDEMLKLRADHTHGTKSLTRDNYSCPSCASEAVTAFEEAARAWRRAVREADGAPLDLVGHSAYPYGSDREVPFIEIVWWVNQEVLHHSAEIALLRDLFCVLGRT